MPEKNERPRRRGLSKPILSVLFHNLDRKTFTFHQLKELANDEIAKHSGNKAKFLPSGVFFSNERLEKAVSKFVSIDIMNISEENGKKILRVNTENLLKIAAPPGTETGKAPSKKRLKEWKLWKEGRTEKI